MNKKKILILSILLIAILGMAISSVNAVTKTTGKIYFKDSYYAVEKKVGPKTQDKIDLWYCSKKHNHKNDWGSPGYQTAIGMNSPYFDSSKYHLKSAKITFVKKVNGKYKTATKSFKADKWETIGYNAPNGYRPYYARVTYYYN